MKNLFHLDSNFLSNLGIVDWGYTEEAIPRSLGYFENWLNHGQQGPLNYLADYRRELRSNLKQVYPEFQSALVFLFSYQKAKKWLLENNKFEIAGYSLGFEGYDYHFILKEKLELIYKELLNIHPQLLCSQSLDVQPVLERDLAYRSGLGWFGKNSMLINRKEGSYFIIGSLLLNQKLQLDSPAIDVDHCGQCTACIEACPTQAIDPASRTLVASKCISTFTIELFKDAPPPNGFAEARGEIFGCDICQDVCPWNRKPLERVESSLALKENFSFLKEWFFEMPKLEFLKFLEANTNRGLKKKLFGTAFDRPGKTGWIKNLKALINSNRNDF